MENETLKQLVLAKGREIAPTFPARQEIAPFVEIEQHYARYGYSIYRKFQDGDREIEVCRIHDELPANNSQWWIAAKILDIPTEMSIDEFEQDLTNRQYVHDLRQAFDAGGDWGFAKANGAKVHCDVAFNQFMEKEPQAPAHEPVPFFDSQLRELCVALGWHGGTYHQVLAEVKRLKAATPRPDAITFVGYVGSKTWKGTGSEYIGVNCGEFGMIELTSAVKEKGKPIHQMYCEHVKITVEQLTIDEAKSEFTAIGGTWHEKL